MAFVFSMVFSLAFFVYISLINQGVDLREIPEEADLTAPEMGLAATEDSAEVDLSQISELWVSTEVLVAHGRQVYSVNCAMCHGPGGQGDGPAAAGLVPPPANLVTGPWKQGATSVALYQTLLKGVPGTSMAAFAHLPKEDLWALVHYMRSIAQNKPDDDARELEEFARSL